jgi:ketosteroid isomerase-like protein
MGAEELMRTIAAAFERGDLRPLMDSIHPDIVWKSASSHVGLFRFGGAYQDRTGILDVTSKIAMDYTFRFFKPREIIARGDVVWGLFDAEMDYQPLGQNLPPKAIRLEIAIRWRLKDGKIIEHQAFFDTASLLAQQGQLHEETA